MLKIFAAAAAVGLGLAAAPHAQAAEPAFTATPCVGDFSGVTAKVDCGVLSVDETRGGRSGRRVAMPVAIVRASAPKPGAVPVVVLHGGPGGGSVANLAARLRGAWGRELIGIDQDWIFFDQRGGQLSAPALDCGEVALNDAGPLSDAAAQALIACGARHAAAGVDLSRYNAEEVARDVQDLRKVLGIKRFDLFGASYGTRIEMAILRHQPAGVRAVVMDSLWPPEATWAENGPVMVSDAVKDVFARCEADAACAARYPTVRADFQALAQRFMTGPQTVKGRTYTADDLGGFLMDAAYSGPGVRSLPKDAAAFVAGDFSALDAHIAERSGYVEAQHMAHLCKEEFPFENEAKVAELAAGDPVAQLSVRSMQRYFQVCRQFPVGAPDPVEALPVVSPVPTLFLSAEIDPGCPPALAAASAKRFAHAQNLTIPGSTHATAGNSPCARKLIRAFLADPSAPLDAACTTEPKKFAFEL